MWIKNLYKSYGNHVVFENFSMEIPKGEWTYIKGPSGCGKTTLLRILMGLEKVDSGNIIWDVCEQTHNSQTRWSMSSTASEGTFSAKNERPNITAVFQEDRLCMNESAIRNVAMVLRSQDIRLLLQREKTIDRQATQTKDRQAKDRQITDIGEVILSHFPRVGLTDIEALHQPVSKLSGGMRRRVAIVRAVLAPGDMLLLDEPFQGLDEDTKKQVVQYIREEQRGRTILLVTHDEDGVDISHGSVDHT